MHAGVQLGPDRTGPDRPQQHDQPQKHDQPHVHVHVHVHRSSHNISSAGQRNAPRLSSTTVPSALHPSPYQVQTPPTPSQPSELSQLSPPAAKKTDANAALELTSPGLRQGSMSEGSWV